MLSEFILRKPNLHFSTKSNIYVRGTLVALPQIGSIQPRCLTMTISKKKTFFIGDKKCSAKSNMCGSSSLVHKYWSKLIRLARGKTFSFFQPRWRRLKNIIDISFPPASSPTSDSSVSTRTTCLRNLS